MSVRERLDRYWFDPAPLRDLALLRVAIVLVLLGEALWPGALATQLRLARLPGEWFDPIPSLKIMMLPLGWGARPGAAALVAAWIVCGVSGLAALIGAYTRLSITIFAIAVTFLLSHLYSYGTLQHSEAAAVIVLWMLILTPCGEALSVDALRARVARSARLQRFVPREGQAMSRDARWPLRAVQWLLVIIYLSAALWKLVRGHSAWMNGYTMQFHLLVDGSTHGVPLAIAAARVHWMGVVSAVVTVLFELTFVVCVLFPRTAPVYLAVGVALHTGIWILMRAEFFQLVALYAAFAEPIRDAARRWAPRPAHGGAMRATAVIFDGYCPLCIRTVTQLNALDVAGRLGFVDLEREWARAHALAPGVTREQMRAAMLVVTPDGRVRSGFLGVREICKRLPVLWPLVPIMYAPGAVWAGSRVYAWVAANRVRRLCEGDACAVHGTRGAAEGSASGPVIEFEGSAS